MIHVDKELARDLEGLISVEFHRICEVASTLFPSEAPQCLDVAGGVALWLGEGSPVNLAAGLGMGGPVFATDLKRVETYYHERGADAMASVCPYADRSLVTALSREGWRISDFENLFVLDLAGGPLDGEHAWETSGSGQDRRVEVSVCSPEERTEWADVAARGFSEGAVPEKGHKEFGLIMAEREEAILVLARVDGEPVGTGSLVIDEEVGWLSGDSTLPGYRRRGVQQAIQRHRLRLARDAGCGLAVTEAVPGGPSQRNMERLGFRLAYTHLEFVKPAS